MCGIEAYVTIGYHMESLQVEFGILHLLHDSLYTNCCVFYGKTLPASH